MSSDNDEARAFYSEISQTFLEYPAHFIKTLERIRILLKRFVTFFNKKNNSCEDVHPFYNAIGMFAKNKDTCMLLFENDVVPTIIKCFKMSNDYDLARLLVVLAQSDPLEMLVRFDGIRLFLGMATSRFEMIDSFGISGIARISEERKSHFGLCEVIPLLVECLRNENYSIIANALKALSNISSNPQNATILFGQQGLILMLMNIANNDVNAIRNAQNSHNHLDVDQMRSIVFMFKIFSIHFGNRPIMSDVAACLFGVVEVYNDVRILRDSVHTYRNLIENELDESFFINHVITVFINSTTDADGEIMKLLTSRYDKTPMIKEMLGSEVGVGIIMERMKSTLSEDSSSCMWLMLTRLLENRSDLKTIVLVNRGDFVLFEMMTKGNNDTVQISLRALKTLFAMTETETERYGMFPDITRVAIVSRCSGENNDAKTKLRSFELMAVLSTSEFLRPLLIQSGVMESSLNVYEDETLSIEAREAASAILLNLYGPNASTFTREMQKHGSFRNSDFQNFNDELSDWMNTFSDKKGFVRYKVQISTDDGMSKEFEFLMFEPFINARFPSLTTENHVESFPKDSWISVIKTIHSRVLCIDVTDEQVRLGEALELGKSLDVEAVKRQRFDKEDWVDSINMNWIHTMKSFFSKRSNVDVYFKSKSVTGSSGFLNDDWITMKSMDGFWVLGLNRELLGIRSTFFRDFFNGSWPDAQNVSYDFDYDIDVLMAVVRFLFIGYDDKLRTAIESSDELAYQTLEFAHRYHITRLQIECECSIAKRLKDDVGMWMSVMNQMDLPYLNARLYCLYRTSTHKASYTPEMMQVFEDIQTLEDVNEETHMEYLF